MNSKQRNHSNKLESTGSVKNNNYDDDESPPAAQSSISIIPGIIQNRMMLLLLAFVGGDNLTSSSPRKVTALNQISGNYGEEGGIISEGVGLFPHTNDEKMHFLLKFSGFSPPWSGCVLCNVRPYCRDVQSLCCTAGIKMRKSFEIGLETHG